MSEKPTPGPWMAKHFCNPITWAEAAVLGPDGDMVAMVYGNLGLDGDPMATANLISAAPDLIEALEVVEWITRDDDWNPICPLCKKSKSIGHSTHCKLGNALKKAIG